MHNFTWMKECHQAFEELYKYLRSPPLLSKPKMGKELYLYLATFLKVESSVLTQVDDKEIQKPIYYTSRVLHDTETRYSKDKKNIYTIIISMQHLRPYL